MQARGVLRLSTKNTFVSDFFRFVLNGQLRFEFSRSPAFGNHPCRPICLVQFEQRSGDNFAVRFSLAGEQRFWALAYCPYCPLTPEFGYIRWKIWKWAKEWTVRKDSKICDLR